MIAFVLSPRERLLPGQRAADLSPDKMQRLLGDAVTPPQLA